MLRLRNKFVYILLLVALQISSACSKESGVNRIVASHTFPASSEHELMSYIEDDSSLNSILSKGIRHIEIVDTVEVIDDLVVPYGVTLEIKAGGLISSGNSKQVIIYGNFDAGNYKVFDDDIQIKFGAGSIEKVNVNWFGAFADTHLVKGFEGKDDTKQIQRAIEAAEFVKNVYLPSYRLQEFKWYGSYRIRNTIQVGSVEGNFNGISLFGEVSYDKPKSSIYADFKSGPAINVQSARGSIIAYLAITGTNLAPVENKELYSNDMNDYVSTGIDKRTESIYAGIAIDALPGKPGSANTIIKYCRISRFFVGINVSAAGQTQGDMLSVEHNALEYNAVQISVGNSQARSISITRCDIGRAHTVLDNLTIGPRLGSTVNFSHNQITNCYQLLNYSTAASGPSEMSGNYGENLGRIGIVMGGRNQNPLTIRDSTLKFAPTGYKVQAFFEGQSKLVISSCLIQVNGKENLFFKNSKNTHFEHTRFRGKKGMPSVSGDRLSFENCIVSNASREEPINAQMELPKK